MPFISASSCEADAPDVECKGAGLSRGDHQPDLADAVRVERRGTRDVATAEARTERRERQAEGLPVAALGCEAGLVEMPHIMRSSIAVQSFTDVGSLKSKRRRVSAG